MNCSENKYKRNWFQFFTFTDRHGNLQSSKCDYVIKKNGKYYGGKWVNYKDCWKFDNLNSALRVAANLDAYVFLEQYDTIYDMGGNYTEFLKHDINNNIGHGLFT